MSKHKLCHPGSKPTPPILHVWELHTGTIKLFICGPGQDAWLACSESYYSGTIGSDEEREIALAAVALLNRDHLQDKDAGPTEIRAALERARRLFSAACAS